MAKKVKNPDLACRLGKVGGQAVLEGVMMKAGDRTVTTCRKEDGSLYVDDGKFSSVRSKNKLLDLPVIRGVVNFIEMMKLSVKTLNVSADALGIEEEEGKTEKWLKKHFGIKLTDFIMIIGVVLGLALAVTLFIFLPKYATDGLEWSVNHIYFHIGGYKTITFGLWEAVIEGLLKIAIFITYLSLVALLPDIKRTFMYHGAEHKSIACFEAGAELTPENAKKYRRFHPRCGTSFMFFMIALGIVAGLFVRIVFPQIAEIKNQFLSNLAYTGIRLVILPVVMGLGYEIIRFAGKHDNLFTRILSAPGLWVQRITTKEPTDDMLECAIISLKCALRDEYPEFEEFYQSRAWEPKTDAEETCENSADCATAEEETQSEKECDTDDCGTLEEKSEEGNEG